MPCIGVTSFQDVFDNKLRYIIALMLKSAVLNSYFDQNLARLFMIIASF